MRACVERFLIKDLLAFLSLVMSWLTFLSFISLLIAPFHVFFGRPLRKLPLTLKVLYLVDQAFSSILFRWPNHCSLLSSKHSPMLFNLTLALIYSEEIPSSGQTFHIHLTIFASFLSSLITSSLFGQVSPPYIAYYYVHKQNLICILLLMLNLSWLTKALNFWTYSIHLWYLL